MVVGRRLDQRLHIGSQRLRVGDDPDVLDEPGDQVGLDQRHRTGSDRLAEHVRGRLGGAHRPGDVEHSGDVLDVRLGRRSTGRIHEPVDR